MLKYLFNSPVFRDCVFQLCHEQIILRKKKQSVYKDYTGNITLLKKCLKYKIKGH